MSLKVRKINATKKKVEWKMPNPPIVLPPMVQVEVYDIEMKSPKTEELIKWQSTQNGVDN